MQLPNWLGRKSLSTRLKTSCIFSRSQLHTSHYLILTAVCRPSGCLNGGHCVSPGHCACPHNYRGSRCELGNYSASLHLSTRSYRMILPLSVSIIGTCTDTDCLHGDCGSNNTCICNYQWYGERCDKAVCYPPDGCLNGGHCVAPGHCSCAAGYRGERCDEGEGENIPEFQNTNVSLTLYNPLFHSVECRGNCLHGTCQGETCVCHYGWEGTNCNQGILC